MPFRYLRDRWDSDGIRSEFLCWLTSIFGYLNTSPLGRRRGWILLVRLSTQSRQRGPDQPYLRYRGQSASHILTDDHRRWRPTDSVFARLRILDNRTLDCWSVPERARHRLSPHVESRGGIRGKAQNVSRTARTTCRASWGWRSGVPYEAVTPGMEDVSVLNDESARLLELRFTYRFE